MDIETFEKNGILYLKDITNNSKPICIDFSTYIIDNKPLLKACGVNNKNKIKILDCTAGLVKDTFALAYHNSTVISIEKNKIIFDLIENAVKRGINNSYIKDILDRITFLNMDSIDFLENTKQIFDCIYLDPMFEENKKSRLVKKNMQIFHKLTDNSNNEKLFDLALKRVNKRIVVKRALHGDFLVDRKPSFQVKEKTVRFDVYLK